MGNMGVDNLKNHLTNAARVFLWDVLIPVPIGDGDSVTYQIRAQSSEIPARGNEVITIPYKATAGIRVAGKLNYGGNTWECTFIEGEDKKVFDAIFSWQQKIVDNVAGIGVGDPLYKTDVYITLQKVSGETFMKLKMKGAWIQNMGKTALQYGTDETIKYSVTFCFDSVEDAS
jgi:hypothetical protein